MTSKNWCGRRLGHLLRGFCARLDRDEGGAISIISVFAIVLLAMLLGMVMNVGRHVDHKVKMQNAADAAAISGGLVIARGMNTVAFTNHLLCDVFALDAFMREARDRNSEQQVPAILDAWAKIGPWFSMSEFPKFQSLGDAITEKVPLEREMVRTYGEWAAAGSELMLPVVEEILQKEQIPEFQRALVRSVPQLAQAATAEVAERHGMANPQGVALRGVLWRNRVDPVGGTSEEEVRTLPVLDPVREESTGLVSHMDLAKRQREALAHIYLKEWNRESVDVFDKQAKMSRFGSLWRGFTCGYLKKLLHEEYPDTNLPHTIRTTPDEIVDVNLHLDENYMFVAVVYGPHVPEVVPGVFKNSAERDALAYAQVTVLIPRPRLVRGWQFQGPPSSGGSDYGGVPGQFGHLPGCACDT